MSRLGLHTVIVVVAVATIGGVLADNQRVEADDRGANHTARLADLESRLSAALDRIELLEQRIRILEGGKKKSTANPQLELAQSMLKNVLGGTNNTFLQSQIAQISESLERGDDPAVPSRASRSPSRSSSGQASTKQAPSRTIRVNVNATQARVYFVPGDIGSRDFNVDQVHSRTRVYVPEGYNVQVVGEGTQCKFYMDPRVKGKVTHSSLAGVQNRFYVQDSQ